MNRDQDCHSGADSFHILKDVCVWWSSCIKDVGRFIYIWCVVFLNMSGVYFISLKSVTCILCHHSLHSGSLFFKIPQMLECCSSIGDDVAWPGYAVGLWDVLFCYTQNVYSLCLFFFHTVTYWWTCFWISDFPKQKETFVPSILPLLLLNGHARICHCHPTYTRVGW
jgi:hypothetical protein